MGEWESWTSTLLSELPLWELESRWTFKCLESNCRGQNPLDWRVPYIIGKLLEHRCLKWACMTDLDIWNTCYGQNYQINSRPLKVGNHFDILACRWRTTYHWKAFDEGYNFALNLISIRGSHTNLWPREVTGVPILGIQNAIWMLVSWPVTKYIIRGKVVASPKFGLWWVLWIHVC
jgi:hypothetical protein